MNAPDDPRPTDAAGSAPAGDGSHLQTVIGAVPSPVADSLEAGLAAGFGKASPPRSLLGHMRPVLLKEADGESSLVVKPQSDALPPKAATGDRYRLDGEIARGGMGAVLRGRDVDLGRDLAVKVLLEKYANRPEVARRFIEEAQIGGQLQHPGVVPIYDIGKFGDRPFFTMKLVKGQTLAAILQDRADAHVDRPRLLGIVLQVAQTLAYAHAKGVIHRDLKPANIMVGAFGEVQVMDWGLAKVLAEGGIADEERARRMQQQPEEVTVIRTSRSTGSTGSHGTQTEAGSILGTPAYMPPEQASGDIAHLDRRVDVFGLGAILCEILTGKPPYLGRSGEEVRRKAANGDLADATARLVASLADHELIALAKQCLSPEAIDRPKDAQEVADGLSAYLNGVQERLQTAERERAVAVARAEEEVKTRQVAEEKAVEQRKRRRVQAQLAASLAVLLLGGVSVAWWQTEQAGARRETELRQQLVDEQRAAADTARLARNAEAVAGLLGQAEEALQAGDAAKGAVALEAAKKRSAEGGAEQEADRLGRLDADLALLRDLDAVDQFRWTVVENKFPDPAVVATRTRKALQRFGADPDDVAVEEAAARVSGSVVRERIVAALDRLLRQQRRDEVRALLRRVDADSYRDLVRDAALAHDPGKTKVLAAQDEALEQSPGFVAFLCESPAISVERQRELLQSAVRQRPGELGLLMTLAATYPTNQQKGADECLRWLQAAVAAAPGNVAAHNNLGLTLVEKSQIDDAIAYYRKALELNAKLAGTHSNLGNALAAMGQMNEAIACHRRAIELDPKSAAAHHNLGCALKNDGQVDEAITCYQYAVELDPQYTLAHYGLGVAFAEKGQLDKAIASCKKAVELEPTLAENHSNLGSALAANGQVDEAIACYRKAIELDPKHTFAHYNMGLVFAKNSQMDEAISCFQKVLELDPKHGIAHTNLGNALKTKGRVDEAIAFYRKAIELDPANTLAHYNLGLALAEYGEVDEAIACYQTALELDPKSAATLTSLANAQWTKGQVDEAIACCKKAIELEPTFAMAHGTLGNALSAKGQVDEAIVCLRRAIELDPKLPGAHYNLGIVLSAKGQVDEAIACYRKAIELNPKSADAHNNLGYALSANGQVDEAIACYRTVLELDPKSADAHNDLGGVLKNKGQVDEAITYYQRAVELDPQHRLAHYNLSVAFAEKGQMDKAIASCKKAIELDPTLAENYSNMGSALAATGLVDEAIACYQKAIELEPKSADAHFTLGHFLASQGRFTEALAALRRGHELGRKQRGWSYPSAEWVRQAERHAALEAKLPAFLKGEFQPGDSDSRLALAAVCQGKKLHHAAAGLYAAAFAGDPKLADDLKAGHRYNAVCHAALAAAGQGADANELDDAAKVKLRGQALDWLKSDLALRKKQLKSWWPGEHARARDALSHWQQDTDLVSLRNAAELEKLPADEQQVVKQLWADVETVLRQAGENPQ